MRGRQNKNFLHGRRLRSISGSSQVTTSTHTPQQIKVCTHFLFFKKHKFNKHEAQNAKILRNIARLTLTNITGKITFFNTVMF